MGGKTPQNKHDVIYGQPPKCKLRRVIDIHIVDVVTRKSGIISMSLCL